MMTNTDLHKPLVCVATDRVVAKYAQILIEQEINSKPIQEQILWIVFSASLAISGNFLLSGFVTTRTSKQGLFGVVRFALWRLERASRGYLGSHGL